MGTNRLVAGDLAAVEIQTGPDQVPEVFMDCSLTDEGDATIDTFEVVPAPSPTVSEATSGPARPDLVQTDAVEQGPGAGTAAGWLAVATTLLAGAALALRRPRSRRH